MILTDIEEVENDNESEAIPFPVWVFLVLFVLGILAEAVLWCN